MSAHVARKRFGQNFLVDRGAIAAIVRAIAPRDDEVLVEIGPGLAALTEPLLDARGPSPAHPLHVVELDRDLAARLERRFTDRVASGRLAIHQGDALAFDFTSLAPQGESLRIVGNLPYNISSPLLFRLVEIAERIVDQHFMLQREVVARMVAEPGTSDYGRLTVMLQVRYAMAALFDVLPESFDPPPKVTSSVVRMVPRPVAAIGIDDPATFARIVSQAFSQRRKMLRNTLADYSEALERVGIPATARAEEVSPGDFVALANLVGRP